MSNQPNGGPAFPVPGVTGNLCRGMTLRDYFAGQALAGIVSAQKEGSIVTDVARNTLMLDASVSEMAYAFADAMLRERAKDQQ